MEPGREAGAPSITRVDLHCHTSASFDSAADPAAMMARAASRGLTHVAVTDHETIDGALRAAEAAPAGLTVLIGSEVNTTDGDLIFVHLERALPRGLSALAAIEAGREQGALIGIPHPFDRSRRSLLLNPAHERLGGLVDWIEGWNGRVEHGTANEKAAELARRLGLPSVGASDAHSLVELGAVFTTMSGDPSTAAGLRQALRGPLTITGSIVGPKAGPIGRFRRARRRNVESAP